MSDFSTLTFPNKDFAEKEKKEAEQNILFDQNKKMEEDDFGDFNQQFADDDFGDFEKFTAPPASNTASQNKTGQLISPPSDFGSFTTADSHPFSPPSDFSSFNTAQTNQPTDTSDFGDFNTAQPVPPAADSDFGDFNTAQPAQITSEFGDFNTDQQTQQPAAQFSDQKSFLPFSSFDSAKYQNYLNHFSRNNQNQAIQKEISNLLSPILGTFSIEQQESPKVIPFLEKNDLLPNSKFQNEQWYLANKKIREDFQNSTKLHSQFKWRQSMIRKLSLICLNVPLNLDEESTDMLSSFDSNDKRIHKSSSSVDLSTTDKPIDLRPYSSSFELSSHFVFQTPASELLGDNPLPWIDPEKERLKHYLLSLSPTDFYQKDLEELKNDFKALENLIRDNQQILKQLNLGKQRMKESIDLQNKIIRRMVRSKQSSSSRPSSPLFSVSYITYHLFNYDKHSKLKTAHSLILQQDAEIDHFYKLHSNKEPIKENAVIVILCRESELEDLSATIIIFEQRFNQAFQYPYVLLNEQEFSESFKDHIRSIVSGQVYFGKIPKEQWSYPAHISQEKAAETREEMKDIIYGSSESYRFMCRYNSGFFYKHPLLQKYDYYWRVEPGTKLLCQVKNDPFVLMKEKDLKYGFTIAIHEYQETVETLWETVKEFIQQYQTKYTDFNPTLLKFFQEKEKYNGHHFWSNFEIGSLSFLRSEPYQQFFEYLEKKGGFFYERWGDAPIHSIAVGLFLNKSQVHYFSDIGYFHNPFSNCPINDAKRKDLECDCKVEESISLTEHSCLVDWLLYRPSQYFQQKIIQFFSWIY